MRSSSLLWALALLGSLGCSRPDQPGKAGEDGPRPVETPTADRPEDRPVADRPDDPVEADAPVEGRTSYALVRVDPTSFELTELGRVEFDTAPPFEARALTGGEELEAFVTAVNQVGELHYSDGSPLERTDPRYFQLLAHEWISGEQGLSLRTPSKTDAATRFQLLVLDDGQLRELGTVERDDVDYLDVVEGPTDRRAQLGALLAELNEVEGRALDVAPPTGKARGSHSRLVDRGTPVFGALQHDQLVSKGVVLVPASASADQAITQVGTGPKLWMPGAMSSAPVEAPVLLSLSGPPGGPLGARVLRYEDVAYDDAGLLAYVEAEHGSEPEFELGAVTKVEIAGRLLLACSYRTGSSRARATHLSALWPDSYERAGERVESYGREGLAVELTLGGELEPSDLLAHAQLGIVAASLQR